MIISLIKIKGNHIMSQSNKVTLRVILPRGAKVNLFSTKPPHLVSHPVVIGISMNPSQDPKNLWIQKCIDDKIRCQVIFKKEGEIHSKYYEINEIRIGTSGKFGFSGEFYEPSEELLESRMTLIKQEEEYSQLTTVQKEIIIKSIVTG